MDKLKKPKTQIPKSKVQKTKNSKYILIIPFLAAPLSRIAGLLGMYFFALPLAPLREMLFAILDKHLFPASVSFPIILQQIPVTLVTAKYFY